MGAKQEGIEIKKYHADNGIFVSKAFKEECDLKGQCYLFSGVRVHHQNGVAERNIKTIVDWSQANMVHIAHCWPEHANIHFWLQAEEDYIWVFYHLPNIKQGGLYPNKLWLSCRAPTKEFNRAHVFGCLVYVLDARLQDGHRIPKWSPKSSTWDIPRILHIAFLTGASSYLCCHRKNLPAISHYL